MPICEAANPHPQMWIAKETFTDIFHLFYLIDKDTFHTSYSITQQKIFFYYTAEYT